MAGVAPAGVWLRRPGLEAGTAFSPKSNQPMKPNIGSIDRTLRIIAGLALLATGFFLNSWWGLVGIIPILTGIVRVCPAYYPFGLNTCGTSSEKKD